MWRGFIRRVRLGLIILPVGPILQPVNLIVLLVVHLIVVLPVVLLIRLQLTVYFSYLSIWLVYLKPQVPQRSLGLAIHFRSFRVHFRQQAPILQFPTIGARLQP